MTKTRTSLDKIAHRMYTEKEKEEIEKENGWQERCSLQKCPNCGEVWDYEGKVKELHFFQQLRTLRLDKEVCPICSGNKPVDKIITDDNFNQN